MADREKYQDFEGAWGSRVPEAEVGSFENEGAWGTHLRWSRSGEYAAKEPYSEDRGEEVSAEQDQADDEQQP